MEAEWIDRNHGFDLQYTKISQAAETAEARTGSLAASWHRMNLLLVITNGYGHISACNRIASTCKGAENPVQRYQCTRPSTYSDRHTKSIRWRIRRLIARIDVKVDFMILRLFSTLVKLHEKSTLSDSMAICMASDAPFDVPMTPIPDFITCGWFESQFTASCNAWHELVFIFK
jgi:hypothetical protein